MPEISRFYGIIIRMNYDDHNPPHFHAEYGDFKAVIKISDYTVLAGVMPPRAFGLIMEWTAIHKDDLLLDWALSKENAVLSRIAPLE